VSKPWMAKMEASIGRAMALSTGIGHLLPGNADL